MAYRRMEDGRWRVSWRDPRRGGRIIHEYFGRGDEAKANAIERDHQVRVMKARSHNRAAVSDGPTYRDLAQDYIDLRGVELAAVTRAEVCRIVAQFALPVIGRVPIGRVTMVHWNAIERRIQARGAISGTINKYFHYISHIFTWGVERGYLQDNPWRRRRTLRSVRRPHIELVTPEELGKIVEAADDHLRWAIEVELNVGCRPPSELCALKWEDFNLETGAVRIFSPKTDSFHTQYVSGEFLERLEARRAWCREEALRLAKRRGEVRPECPYVVSFQGERVLRLDSAWEAAKKRAKIERRVRLYDLRHYYITHALAGGAGILDLAHRVGHKDATMIVSVYAHLVEQMQSKAPLYRPDPGLQAFFVPKMLSKNVIQNEKGPEGPSFKNVISFEKHGRGERI